jgi:protein-tyrosine phosphatase
LIDTHCHLLPRVDDGPRTDADAIRLARKLSDEGVTTVVCTPHFSEHFPTPSVLARERHDELRRELDVLGIELETTLAAEVSVGLALRTPLERLRARAIAGRYLLVELVSDTPAPAARAVAGRLAEAELLPIFAHPERCRAVQLDPTLLDEVREAGALVQVVAPSLAGRWGDEVWRAAWQLVESGRADLLASDAHRVSASSPQLAAVATLVESRCGRERREELTETAPRRLLEATAAA